MKILVDVNAKGLVRWLRFLGIDTESAPALAPDEEVKTKALASQRLLLTRDRQLAESMNPDQVVHLSSDQIKTQLAEVLRRVPVPLEAEWFTRCTECNTLLHSLNSLEIATDARIPHFVKDSTDPQIHSVWKCESCARVYWKGSHYDRTHSLLQASILLLHQ